MMNPIESAWSFVKATVKRNLADRMATILGGEDQGNLSKSEHRLQALESEITSAIAKVTPSMCANFIAHIQNLLPSILNCEDVQF